VNFISRNDFYLWLGRFAIPIGLALSEVGGAIVRMCEMESEV
jgi:hypothetical protein